MKKLGLLLIWIFTVLVCHAAIIDDKSSMAKTEGTFGSLLKQSFIIASYQNLRSTHVDHFTGFNVMAGYYFTPKLSLAIGIEDVYGQRHDDNGWKLSEIRLVPVIVDARYLIGENKFIIPFIELSTGITFLKYYKKVKVPAGSPDITETDGPWFFGRPFLVKERGLYTYLGGGAYFRINKHFMPFIGIGFKGNRMTFNNLDVNPRGLNYEIGCKF
jgi:hypothetical protein